MLVPYEQCLDLIKQKQRNISVELLIGTKCQKACKYCYRVKNQNDYGITTRDDIDRLRLYYDNAVEMGLLNVEYKYDIELFGGDPVVDLDILRYIHDKFKDVSGSYVLPSNTTVIENLAFSDIDKLVEYFENKIYISISADTPFMEEKNRPLSAFGKLQGLNEKRDWDKLVEISKRYKWGFHPMLWLENVDNWFNAFKWCVEKGVRAYFLEVRHGHHDFETIKKGVQQVFKMRKYCEENEIDHTKFNLMNFPRIPRGLSCSALSNLLISYNGKSYFCHRLIDQRFMYADLQMKKIDPTKFLLFNSGMDYRNCPTCVQCPINQLCHSICPGMVDEYWGNLGSIQVPIISMCKYFLLKFGVLFKHFDYDPCYNDPSYNEFVDFDYLYKYINNIFYDGILDDIVKGVDFE